MQCCLGMLTPRFGGICDFNPQDTLKLNSAEYPEAEGGMLLHNVGN